MKRKPSPSRLAKGLEPAAQEAERYANKLHELGLGELAGDADKALKLASN